jgi:hypothetical protein
MSAQSVVTARVVAILFGASSAGAALYYLAVTFGRRDEPLKSGDRDPEITGLMGFDLYPPDDANNCRGHLGTKRKHFLLSPKSKNRCTDNWVFSLPFNALGTRVIRNRTR